MAETRDLRRVAQMGSDTFSIPNEVRPHCAADDRAGHPYLEATGGFSGLREVGHKSLLATQWGLVRTVVDSDGLPAKDRTSLASLTPHAPESSKRSESGFNITDAASMIPRMESSQHIGELKMGVGVRRFEADF